MPKALLSVYDKTGLVDFAKALVDLGWELLASGGTANLLIENGLKVVEVADYTGSPEILNGRVKTLHPAIHAGLLARNSAEDINQLNKFGWSPIDLVVVNLYPFKETVAKPNTAFSEAIEQIDIGGVALIRAAAKNHDRVTLLCDPQDYSEILDVLKKSDISADLRRKLALKGFRLTAHYDTAIANYFENGDRETLNLHKVQSLRYGENPHQTAELLSFHSGYGPLGGKILHGKELSYNNLLDLDAAWRAVVSFQKSSIVIVKHLSPCGIASGVNQVQTYRAALASDPVSAFGGIIASNRILEVDTALAIKELFIECIIAPGFQPEALEILSKKKNLRLVEMPDLNIEPIFEYRSIIRGMLKQSVDLGDPLNADWNAVTERHPDNDEMVALKFAWKACQHVKSNAIVFAKGEVTVGIGGGQPNRVDCIAIAAQRAGEKSKGAVMSSDAFFPFSDSIEAAAAYGITAVVQPGGSIRDLDSIKAANDHDIAMIFTGYRHFRH